MSKEQTKEIVKSLGGPYALADAMNSVAANDKERITPQAISLWVRVPVGRCLQIERATNGARKCHQLRPDMFPAPSDEVAA